MYTPEVMRSVDNCSVKRLDRGVFITTVDPDCTIYCVSFLNDSMLTNALRSALTLHEQTGCTVIGLAGHMTADNEYGCTVMVRTMSTDVRRSVEALAPTLFSNVNLHFVI